MSIRSRALPALATGLLLTATGCAASAPAAEPALAAAALTTETAPAPAATVPSSTDTPAAAAPAAAVASPATSGKPAAGTGRTVALVAYDPASGRATLHTGNTGSTRGSSTTPGGSRTTGAPHSPNATASASTSASASASAAPDTVRTGQLIASPPTPAAPRGALVAVTGVQKAEGDTVEVTTRPAEVAELLGATATEQHRAIDVHGIHVQPLVKDLKVGFTTRPGGGNGSASAQLSLDASTSVPLPGGAKADLAAGIRLDPSVDFSYDGRGILKGGIEKARVGFGLGAHADWKVDATLAASPNPLRVPLAKLSASPVLTVAGFPVVVNLDLTCYLTVGADGKLTVEAEQDLDGAWAVHADYAKGKGWTTAADPGTTTVGPVRAKLSGEGSLRTGLTAEASVGLYDTVGVAASIEPHLTSRVAGSVTLDTTGKPPHVEGSWTNTAGLDINGRLYAQIKILGTPLLKADLPLPAFHREWPLPSLSTTH
ncbi:hypothetical protein [Streptomyces sp. NRRL B-24484]|uniref:hypothetical protein n=1 Tax=Streptomyces sp. NRRL B-24484 TaxID=1463833 RepID=UPI0004C285A6|nr:hypothetical protein [Streptomyces sp. NRRL B-24484]